MGLKWYLCENPRCYEGYCRGCAKCCNRQCSNEHSLPNRLTRMVVTQQDIDDFRDGGEASRMFGENVVHQLRRLLERTLPAHRTENLTPPDSDCVPTSDTLSGRKPLVPTCVPDTKFPGGESPKLLEYFKPPTEAEPRRSRAERKHANNDLYYDSPTERRTGTQTSRDPLTDKKNTNEHLKYKTPKSNPQGNWTYYEPPTQREYYEPPKSNQQDGNRTSYNPTADREYQQPPSEASKTLNVCATKNDMREPVTESPVSTNCEYYEPPQEYDTASQTRGSPTNKTHAVDHNASETGCQRRTPFVSYDEPDCTLTVDGDRSEKKHNRNRLPAESASSRVRFAKLVEEEPNSGVLPRVPLPNASDRPEKSILKVSLDICCGTRHKPRVHYHQDTIDGGEENSSVSTQPPVPTTGAVLSEKVDDSHATHTAKASTKSTPKQQLSTGQLFTSACKWTPQMLVEAIPAEAVEPIFEELPPLPTVSDNVLHPQQKVPSGSVCSDY